MFNIFRFVDYTPLCPECHKNDEVHFDFIPACWHCKRCNCFFD